LNRFLYLKIFYHNVIITISGLPGSGKTSVGKIIAKRLKIKFFSIGNMVREYAKDNKIPLDEMEKLISEDYSVNVAIDDKQKKLLKYKSFIIDSRIGAFIFKNANFRIYIHASFKKRIERIARREKKSIAKAGYETRIRERNELKQYKRHYNIDYRNKKYYNLIINTENLDENQTADRIIKVIETKNKG